jgi:peptidoglycan/LPS O-acetylase OafA/YrhL
LYGEQLRALSFRRRQGVLRLVVVLPDGTPGMGAEIARQFEAAVRARGIEVRFGQRAVRLVQDAGSAVVGVETAGADGKTARLRARRGVVFGTGGFIHNADLRRRFLRGPVYGGCTVPAAQGDFIPIAQAAGAQLGNMQHGWWAELVFEQAVVNSAVPMNVFVPPGDAMLQVDRTGRRYVNEKFVYNERSQLHFVWDPQRAEYRNLLTFMVYDRRVAEQFAGAFPLPQGPAPYVIEGADFAALGAGLAEARRFWARRLLRIYPVHLATALLLLALVAGAALLGLAPRDPGRFGAGALAAQLLLLHGWGLGGRWAWNYPSWSISTEWAGYLAFPLLWLVVRRASAAACVVLLGVMALLLAATDLWSGGLNLTLHRTLARFFPEFRAGMLCLRLLPLVERRLPAPALGAGGLGLATAGLLFWRDWVVVAGLALVLAALVLAARQARPAALARIPCLLRLDGLSYAVYMSFAIVETAQAVAWRHFAVAPSRHPLAYGLLATGLTLALAALLSRVVERPAQRLSRHLAGGGAGG